MGNTSVDFGAIERWYHEELFPPAAVDLYRIIDEYTAECSRCMLADTGVLDAMTEPVRVEEALDRAGVSAQSRALLRRAVQIVVQYGMGTRDADDRVQLQQPKQLFDLAALREQGVAAEPTMAPAFEIIDKVREGTAEFAKSQTDGMQIRSKVHMDFFLKCPIGLQTSELGGEAIRHILETRAEQPWTLLELGGGTMSGALSTLNAIAKANLQERVAQYHFTEINAFFVMRASGLLPDKYPKVGDFRFSVLDFNNKLAQVDDASVDLVHGVNCLQCAVNLPATLAEIERILKPGGFIVIPQYTRAADDKPLPLVDLVCEPLPSYWNVELIAGVRPVHGMPTADTWDKLLGQAGFVQFQSFPTHKDGLEWFKDDKYYVGVLVAQKPL